MRDFSPDRPDKTDCPYTVDAGHVQWEMSFVNYTCDNDNGISTRTWNVAPFNLKIGLLNYMDLQLIYDDYLNVFTKDTATGTSLRQSGFGDLTARVKMNLWGNDGGTTAFGFVPYVKFPVNTDQLGNHAVEGGVGLLLAVKLPYDFDLGSETAVGALQNDNDSNYHGDIANSVTIDHQVIGNLSAYIEFFSDLSTERHNQWVGTIDFGLEFLLSKNVQLDCGCNFGVTHAADDFNPFAGITMRF
jgi:hypothetical protein